MAIDQETFNTRLYSLLKTRGYKPVPRDVNNERTTPQDAEVFEFTFKKGDDTYGLAWVTIDQASNLKVYYNDEQSNSPKGKTKGAPFDDSWSGFLRHLKQWAQSKQLSFELQDGDRPGDDMRQRETNKKKEKMSEGYHAVNQKTSYNDNIPNVKVVIQHDRAVQEGEQRWRNVHKIFVENTEGERFAVPTRMPGIARVYGRHVAEGGTPYDDRGKHITSLVEEYTQMAGFVRATRKGQFNESVALLIAEGVNHHKKLKESLQKMQSHRGYNAYFESWTPPLMEDDGDSSSIAEMFTQGAIDPRIESVLPILNRLNSGIINEIEEVSELDQWAKGITEITEEVVEENISDNKPDTIDSEMDAYFGSKPGELEEEKRDTHCSAKCCGADVKAEDCTCSPDCEHCNCNKKKLDENPLVGMAARAVVGSAAGAVKDNMEEEKLDEVASDYNHLQDEFDQLISDLKQKHQSDEALQAAIEALLSQYIKKIKDFKNIESTEKQYALGMAGRLQDYLEDEFNGNYSGSKFQGDAISAAGLQAKMELEKERNKSSRTSDRDKSAIGRAIAGVMGLAEFQERDYDDERWEDEPEKFNPKLVDKKTGQEVKLPYTTKDFRGDEVIVVGFNAPKHQASTGRIHTDDGMSYFPSVVGLKIVGHEFDDNLNEGRVKDVIHDAMDMSREEFDAKYKGEWSYDEALADYEELDETKSGGMEFAGNYKTGSAGQWKNTGKTKGRPAKVGDLVGASESFDPMSEPKDSDVKFEAAMEAYDAHGEEGLAKALGMSIEEFDQELNEYGMEHGLHADDDRDTIIHGMVEQMIDDADQMASMRRLSGLEEAGKPTTNSNHSTERDKKTYDPAHGHTKPEGGKPGVCKACSGAGCHRCDDGQVVTPKRNDKKVDEAENSPDGNAGADDDGDNDKYNQDASTVQDRKSIQEADELLAIIKGIKVS
jgi:hypothetical protein